MKRPGTQIGRRARLLAGATAAAIVMVVAMPAALASYSSSFTPAENFSTHTLATPTSLTCSGSGVGAITLNWAVNADSTTADPYGAFVIDGYLIERSVNGGAFSTLSTVGRTAITASDNNFGLLSLNDAIAYRIRSTRSSWTSAASNTVSGRVTGFLVVNLATCPHA